MEVNFYKVQKATYVTVEGTAERAGWLELRIEEEDRSPITITLFSPLRGGTPKIEEAVK